MVGRGEGGDPRPALRAPLPGALPGAACGMIAPIARTCATPHPPACHGPQRACGMAGSLSPRGKGNEGELRGLAAREGEGWGEGLV